MRCMLVKRIEPHEIASLQIVEKLLPWREKLASGFGTSHGNVQVELIDVLIVLLAAFYKLVLSQRLMDALSRPPGNRCRRGWRVWNARKPWKTHPEKQKASDGSPARRTAVPVNRPPAGIQHSPAGSLMLRAACQPHPQKPAQRSTHLSDHRPCRGFTGQYRRDAGATAMPPLPPLDYTAWAFLLRGEA